MIKEIWSVFPRTLEQKINRLLEEAEPNALKAFHLYKSCQQESLWSKGFESFSEVLREYFRAAPHERRKAKLDQWLERPTPHFVYEGFHLDFRSAQVNQRSLQEIASWAHHLLRVSYKSTSQVISEDVLVRTLNAVVSPGPTDKARDIVFDDFCRFWKKTVFRLFGKKYDGEFERILKDLNALDAQLRAQESFLPDETKMPFVPSIYLTQTEIDWTEQVMAAVQAHLPAPAFPLSRGPEKQRLIELEKTLTLYQIVQNSRWPEFVRHRENIKATIIDRCQRLLKECAR